MKSFDYSAVAHDADIYCVECLPDGVDESECSPVFADSEHDTFPVCSVCGTVHDYVGLTAEGQIGYRSARNGWDIVVVGVGFDACFEVVYTLSQCMFAADGYALSKRDL